MKTLRSLPATGLLLVSLVVPVPTRAQPTEIDLSRQQEAIRALSLMFGEWHGVATIDRGPQAETSQIVETITPRLEDTVLVIEALGTSARADGTTATTHEAIAFVWFDEAQDRYRMRSFIPGRTTEADFDLTEDGIVWGFETPRGGRVRYTATFTDDTWTEHGEFSHDGETWMPFLEMRLQKVMGVMSDE